MILRIGDAKGGKTRPTEAQHNSFAFSGKIREAAYRRETLANK